MQRLGGNATRRKKANGKHEDACHDACCQHQPLPQKHKLNEHRRTLAACALTIGILACISLAYFGLELKREMTELYGVTKPERHRTADSGVSDEERFMDWFHLAGGVNGKVGIQAFPDMGNGVVALENIVENDTLLYVPATLIICREIIFQTIPQELRKKFAKLESNPQEMITAFLLLEFLKGASSRWYPYLQILPAMDEDTANQTIASPMFFHSATDVDALQDDVMIEMAQQERHEAKLGFQRFSRLFRSVLPPKAVSLKRYTWARFLVNSRAFSIRGERFLVPFGDVFNGKGQPRARSFANGLHFLTYHRLDDHGMEIRADRTTQSGQQIFEDYGDNHNYIYFLYHGFVMAENAFDCASVRLPPLGAAEHAQKLKILETIGIGREPRTCVTRDGSISIHDHQLVHMYYQLTQMSHDELETCSQSANYASCFASSAPPAEHELARFLAQATELQLKSYVTSLADDIKMLANGSVSGSEYHAVTFRASRKQLLHDALKTLGAKIQEAEEADSIQEPTSESVEDEPSAVHSAEPPATASEVQKTDEKIERFQDWLKRQDFPINHVELRYVDDVMGYGTFATKPLEYGEVYLSVPVELTMSIDSARRSLMIQKVLERVGDQDGVDESLVLTLHLLEECFGPQHERSQWKPYLDTLPDGRMSPLFYNEQDHLTLLRASDLYPLVANYRRRTAQVFVRLQELLGIVDGKASTFHWITEPRFLWATAMLDSRSIWWSGRRHLVPLLDMVNCLQLAPGHREHSTTLDASTGNRHAITRASWGFNGGDQVVENYGQPNYIYLLYHGFILPGDQNQHDCALFRFEINPHAVHAAAGLSAAQKRRTQQTLMEVLESLDVRSWSPDVCVQPTDTQSRNRFVQLAHVALDPVIAIDLRERQSVNALRAVQIEAARALVTGRIAALARGLAMQEDAAATPEDSAAEERPAESAQLDPRTRLIRSFLRQQLMQLQLLRQNLNDM